MWGALAASPTGTRTGQRQDRTRQRHPAPCGAINNNIPTGPRLASGQITVTLQVLKWLVPIQRIKRQVRHISRSEAIMPQEVLVGVGHIIHLIS